MYIENIHLYLCIYVRTERLHTIVKLFTKLKILTNTPLGLTMSNKRDPTEIKSKVNAHCVISSYPRKGGLLLTYVVSAAFHPKYQGIVVWNTGVTA